MNKEETIHELIKLGFEQTKNLPNWFYLLIDKKHKPSRYDWMKFDICLSTDLYILNVFYDEHVNHHSFTNGETLLKWVKNYMEYIHN